MIMRIIRIALAWVPRLAGEGRGLFEQPTTFISYANPKNFMNFSITLLVYSYLLRLLRKLRINCIKATKVLARISFIPALPV